MLKHEDNPQTRTQPAAQVRVTPEELAAAVTALQIRKEGQPGTIAIGDAVEELGLDVTPEEVLAEVQAGRVKQRYLNKHPSKRGQRSVLALGLAMILLGLVGGGNSLLHQHDGSNMTQVNWSPNPISLTLAPNLTVGDASGKTLMLSEVGDNQSVRCTFDDQSSRLGYYYPNSSALWRLVKHDGKVYARGWMLNVSPKVMDYEGVDVATENNSGFNVPITLPLDGFKVLPSVGSIAQFHAVDVHLDKHAYEKW